MRKEMVDTLDSDVARCFGTPLFLVWETELTHPCVCQDQKKKILLLTTVNINPWDSHSQQQSDMTSGENSACCSELNEPCTPTPGLGKDPETQDVSSCCWRACISGCPSTVSQHLWGNEPGDKYTHSTSSRHHPYLCHPPDACLEHRLRKSIAHKSIAQTPTRHIPVRPQHMQLDPLAVAHMMRVCLSPCSLEHSIH